MYLSSKGNAQIFYENKKGALKNQNISVFARGCQIPPAYFEMHFIEYFKCKYHTL